MVAAAAREVLQVDSNMNLLPLPSSSPQWCATCTAHAGAMQMCCRHREFSQPMQCASEWLTDCMMPDQVLQKVPCKLHRSTCLNVFVFLMLARIGLLLSRDAAHVGRRLAYVHNQGARKHGRSALHAGKASCAAIVSNVCANGVTACSAYHIIDASHVPWGACSASHCYDLDGTSGELVRFVAVALTSALRWCREPRG